MTSTTRSGSAPRADHEAFAALTTHVAGEVALPGDPTFAEAEPWDRSVASRPAAVVFAVCADDVVAAVDFARRHGLHVAVRSTGHGAVPVGDDVLLVHTGRMTDVDVDVEGRWARVGAGVRWQAVLDAACPAGLAPLCGSAPGVGVVGYLTGGGLGPLARTFGVSSDAVRAFDVVTGAGSLLRATPTENADLFWGLRGGKATLGIVTAVEIDLPVVSELLGGTLWFDGEDRAAILAAWRRLAVELPEQGTTSVAVMNLPPLPQLPPAVSGRQTVAVRFAWVGDPVAGSAHLAELRRTATPVLDTVGVMPYAQIGRIHADPVDPMPVTTRSALLGALPPAGVAALADAVGGRNPQTIVELRALGGAVARVPQIPSAVCHRDAQYQLFVSSTPRAGTAAAVTAHTDALFEAMTPWTVPGLLPNFVASDDPDTVARCYDPVTADRLHTLAERYDPAHVLATGQVVRVATRTGRPTTGSTGVSPDRWTRRDAGATTLEKSRELARHRPNGTTS